MATGSPAGTSYSSEHDRGVDLAHATTLLAWPGMTLLTWTLSLTLPLTFDGNVVV